MFVIGTFAWWPDGVSAVANVAAAAFSGASALAVWLLVSQIRLQRTQLHRELEIQYVNRYWAIMDRLDTTPSDSGATELTRRASIRAYLQLSEDECDLRAANRITNDTWELWREAIALQLTDPRFRAELDDMPKDRFTHLRQLLRGPKGYDPCASTKGQQKGNGLLFGKRRPE